MRFKVEWDYQVYDCDSDEDRIETAAPSSVDATSIDDAVNAVLRLISENVEKNHYHALKTPSGIYAGSIRRIMDEQGKVVYTPKPKEVDNVAEVLAAAEHDRTFGHLSPNMADFYDNEVRNSQRN